VGAAGGRAPASAAVFAPLDARSRSDAVARRLSDGIALGLLGDDAQLPSEQELAGAFGVSTVTVREALTSLRARGLVRTQRGRGGGSFVTAPAVPIEAVLQERLEATSPSELRDLADLSAAVSGSAAKLAAERASQDEVLALRATVEELVGAADPAVRRRAQSRLRVEVAAASQSARLTRAEVQLQAEAAPLLWTAATHETGEQCAALVDAIADGLGERARCLAEVQVATSLRRALAQRSRG